MTPNTEVVCIDDSGNVELIENQHYTVMATRSANCNCKHFLVDVGLLFKAGHVEYILWCATCGKRTSQGLSRNRWFRSDRFVPIDSISISEAYEVLEKQPFEL